MALAKGRGEQGLLLSPATPNQSAATASTCRAGAGIMQTSWTPMTTSTAAKPYLGEPNPFWTSEETWQNVYTWINNSQHSNNDSEGGDSARSSSSSHPQISPKQSSIWPLDDLTPPMDEISLFEPTRYDAPSVFDPSPGLFDYPSSRPSPPSAPTPPPQQDLSQFSNIIQELLKLNLQTQQQQQKQSQTQQYLQPQSNYQNYQHMSPPSTSSPQTSATTSPWSLPDEPVYRPAPVQRRQEPQQTVPQQQQPWNRPPTAVTEEPDVFSQIPEIYLMPRTVTASSRAVLMRRNTAAMELHHRLDECSDEYRQLEKERKQTEAELARHNLGKKISSSNGLPIPRLPTAPSRVDRLIVDFFREHARITTLFGKMEQLRGTPLPSTVHNALKELLEAVTVLQHCRHHERSAILQQLRGEVVRYNEEKETMALAQSLITVQHAACRARAANWCSLIWTLGPEDSVQAAQVERLVAAGFSIGPPPIRSRPLKK